MVAMSWVRCVDHRNAADPPTQLVLPPELHPHAPDHSWSEAAGGIALSIIRSSNLDHYLRLLPAGEAIIHYPNVQWSGLKLRRPDLNYLCDCVDPPQQIQSSQTRALKYDYLVFINCHLTSAQHSGASKLGDSCWFTRSLSQEITRAQNSIFMVIRGATPSPWHRVSRNRLAPWGPVGAGRSALKDFFELNPA